MEHYVQYAKEGPKGESALPQGWYLMLSAGPFTKALTGDSFWKMLQD